MTFKSNGHPRGARTLLIIKVVRLPQSNPSILLLRRGSGIFPFEVLVFYFLYVWLETLVFWVRAGRIIFFHSDVYGRRVAAASIFLPWFEICKHGLCPETPRRHRGQWKFLIKRFDTRNIRHRGNFLCPFFFLLNLSRNIFFRHMSLNNLARIPEHPAYL